MKSKLLFLCLVMTAAVLCSAAIELTLRPAPRSLDFPTYTGPDSLRELATNARLYAATLEGPSTDWLQGHFAGQAEAYDHAADLIEQAERAHTIRHSRR